MNVIEIVRKELVATGFGGLFFKGTCSCSVEALAPCGHINGECEAGHVRIDERGERHIGPAAYLASSARELGTLDGAV